jgi:hypothetical protein
MNNTILEDLYIVNSLHSTQNYNNLVYAKLTSWFNLNPNLQFFSLELSDINILQLVFNHVFQYIFSVTVFDIAPIILDFILLIIIVGAYKLLTKTLLIIF